MKNRHQHNASIGLSIVAFMLTICFVSFQAFVTYAPSNQSISLVNMPDIDMEKDAKEEVDKETEQWLSELKYAVIEEQGLATLYATRINIFYSKPHLQVYDPPPELA